MVRVPFTEMQRVIRAAIVRAGMNEPDADLCARIHTESTPGKDSCRIVTDAPAVALYLTCRQERFAAHNLWT